jgi:plastocyanin
MGAADRGLRRQAVRPTARSGTATGIAGVGMRRGSLAGLVFSGVLTAALAGCAGGDPEPVSTHGRSHRPTPAVATPQLAIGDKVRVAGLTANYHGTKNVARTSKVTIEIEDNYFSPTIIKGKPGQRIIVSLENESQSPHTFTIGGRYVDQQIAPGQLSEVPVVLPRSGNLSFFCTFQKKVGMAGGFNVSGPIGKPGPKAKTTR